MTLETWLECDFFGLWLDQCVEDSLAFVIDDDNSGNILHVVSCCVGLYRERYNLRIPKQLWSRIYFDLLDGACYRAWCLYQLLVVHGQHLIDWGRDESLSSVCQLKERLCFGVFLGVVVFLDLRKSCLHHEAFSGW